MTKPSWQNYGTYDDSSYPQLWKGVRAYFAPCLGPTGNILIDHNPRRNHGNGSGLILSSAWSSDAITYSGSNYHAVTEFACSREWSVCGWVRHEGGSFGVNLLGGLGRAADGTNDYLLYMSAANTANMWGNQTPGVFSAATTITTTDSFALNTWQHFCWRVLPSSVEFYLQGKYQGVSAAYPGVVRMGQIGARNGAAGWIGKVSDLVFWDRSISPAEISLHYQVGRGGMLKRAGRRLSRYGFKSYPSKPSKASLINVKPSTPSFENGFAPRDGEADNPNLLKGLVGAWCPSLGVTGNTLRDISGRNNHGTLTNMDPATDWVVSNGQYALDFDGVNDYVSASNVQTFASGTQLTASIWVKRNAASVYAELINKFSGTVAADEDGWLFRWDNGNKLIFTVANSGSYGQYQATNANTSTAWNHVAAVHEFGSTAKTAIYLNGVAIAASWTTGGTQVPYSNATSYPIIIGAQRYAATSYNLWAGQIDDVAVFNRILTPGEIRRLYLLGRGAIYTLKSQKKITTSPSRSTPKSRASIIVRPPKPNTDNLLKGIVGCWSPSLGVTGNTLRDVSGRNNHGVLTNMDPATDWVSTSVRGVHGRVLDYDGTNDSTLLNRNSVILGLTACSVVAWVMARTYGVDGKAAFSLPMSNTADTSPFQVLDLSVSVSRQVRANVGNGLTRVTYTATDLVTTANNWSCIAMLWDGLNITTAMDGRVSSSSASANYSGIGVSATPLGTARIGSYRDEAIYAWDGQIGEVSLFNRRLTASEVMGIYRSGNGAIGRALTQQATRSNFSSKTFPSTWLKVGDEWTEVQPKVATGSQTSIITRPPIEPSYDSGYAPRDGEPLYQNLHKGLVGAWCPSLGVTGRVLRDVSGRNNHGTLTNMDPATDWVVSNGQYALDFDGGDDYVRVAAGMPQWRAISVWVSLNTTGTLQTIAESYGASATNKGLLLYVSSSGKAAFDGRNPQGYQSSGVSIMTVSGVGWVHLFGQYSDRLEIWVNGVRESQTATALSGFSTTSDLNIGGIDTSGEVPPNTAWTSGLIDDLVLYNRALSANEIRQLYLLGRGGILTLKQPSLKNTSTIWQPSQPRLYTGDWT